MKDRQANKLISRKAAKAQGLRFYRTARPCPQGHVGPRRVRQSDCFQCYRIERDQQSGRGSRKACKHNQRAERMGVPGKLMGRDLRKIAASQDGRCVYCSGDIAKGGHVDHINPLSRGGPNCAYNVQLLCKGCSDSKGRKPPYWFAASIGAENDFTLANLRKLRWLMERDRGPASLFRLCQSCFCEGSSKSPERLPMTSLAQ